MPFQKPRILTNTEENIIRGKCLVNDYPGLKPTAEEVMQLIGHFDLLVDAREGESPLNAKLYKARTFWYKPYAKSYSLAYLLRIGRGERDAV